MQAAKVRKPSVTSDTAQAYGWLPPSRIRWYMGKALALGVMDFWKMA
jgi:hypothetical protein